LCRSGSFYRPAGIRLTNDPRFAVGRSYAGVLGCLAFLTCIARGLLAASDIQNTLLKATIGLFAFAIVGYIAGRLAAWIVNDSVRSRIAAEANETKSVAGV